VYLRHSFSRPPDQLSKLHGGLVFFSEATNIHQICAKPDAKQMVMDGMNVFISIQMC